MSESILPPPYLGAVPAPEPRKMFEFNPPVDLARLLFGLALVVGAFDACFWYVNGLGLSVALFFTLLTSVILVNRDRTAWRTGTHWLLLLMTGAVFAGVIETGTINFLVFLILIIALAGQTYFTGEDSLWGRWLAQAVALIRAPGRPFWLIGRMAQSSLSRGLGGVGGMIGSGLLVVPAVVLTLVFGSLLATGNAVFGDWVGSFFDWVWEELALCLNPARLILWGLVAFAVLPLLRPVSVSAWWWSWTQKLPRFPEIMPAQAALFSSSLVLVVLNLLFLVANFADALFLWSGETLPVGVTYSAFVHNGVNTLMVTVLLSAFVLAAIFQQALSVAQRRELKVLGLLWVAQNLFLLLSVALRLKLYIEAYDMTVLRLSVMIFLALVAVGYGLLTVKIVKEKSLSWLIGGCVLAAFACFYITQFLDLAGWSANYNVSRWENDRNKKLDAVYLSNLGAPAWPALRRATDSGALWPEPTGAGMVRQSPIEVAREWEAETPKAQFDWVHWREFNLRAWWNREALDDKK